MSLEWGHVRFQKPSTDSLSLPADQAVTLSRLLLHTTLVAMLLPDGNRLNL